MVYGVILLLICFGIYQYLLRKKLKKEILHIGKKLDEIIEQENYKNLLHNSDEKEIQGLLLSINKLIDEKRSEKIIREERDRRIKEMLSNISHDLKTPLTVILGYAEMMTLDDILNPEEKAETMKSLMDKLKDVLQLINRFFTLAKLESGDKKVEIQNINLSEIIKETIIAFHDILNEKDFEVEVELPEKDIWALGNGEAVERILTNLISNVIRYGDEGKYLGIIVKENSESVNIEIIDKGQGIEKKEMDKIFQRSYTGSASRNKDVSGNGLGLTIVKSLITSLNGEIHVHSIPYKKTCFSFTLKK
jgi:signal transduction histidine kinase